MTYANYLRTLRLLGLEQLAFEDVTVRFLTNRLNTVLHPGTRRKHAINLRSALGVKVPVPKAQRREYDLPDVKEVHEAFADSLYRVQVYAMLYAGARLGEACVKQPIKGNVITFDRQRLIDMSIAAPKTDGPVVVPDWFAEEYAAHHDFDRHHTSLYDGIKRRAKRVGLTLNPHQLRHLFGTELVAAGAQPEVLRRQMRHHDVAVSLKFYVHTKQADIEAVMQRFGQ
ncbi:tyrosine-type recombinase/integrase [Streptomyces sp. NPDC060223]|uniref:tyrosine-type recombinase/integrase n=1 Tax=unclassified Streptomyces TaxID=2593676 RepID=UPI00363513EC